MNHHIALRRRVDRSMRSRRVNIPRRDAHAVVIAGLLASRVLADYFGTVTIYEKDHLADNAVHSIRKRGDLIASRTFDDGVVWLRYRPA